MRRSQLVRMWRCQLQLQKTNIFISNKAHVSYKLRVFNSEMEDVHIKQGQGRMVQLDDSGVPSVYRLIKSLYGLPFAPKLWGGTPNKWLVAYGFQRSTADQVARCQQMTVQILVNWLLNWIGGDGVESCLRVHEFYEWRPSFPCLLYFPHPPNPNSP